MKAIRIITSLLILAAAGAAHASAADNSWLMQTPVGQSASTGGGNTSSPDTLNDPVEP